jgi:hypothetical protein
MIRYTQTSLGIEGNCLQTSIECILEAPQGALPAQREYPLGQYLEPLNAYLARFGLVYVQGSPGPRAFGWHVLTGPSPRTPKIGTYHSVVGRGGQFAWDPHPSRDGICAVSSWGFVVPLDARSDR